MPSTCYVKMCGNRSNRDHTKTFHRIPCIPATGSIMQKKKKLSKERRQIWLASTKRSELPESKLKNFRVCEDHFITGNIFLL